MCKSFVMICRQLSVDVSRDSSGVSRRLPYPFQRDLADCDRGVNKK
jgi:hypothetical protein